ncbi:MAG: hypothetical protein HY903_17425 [Deltaproteobacteria bacterium]|nr:hypothetical protein [Deltaproteobacteria bacterium]
MSLLVLPAGQSLRAVAQKLGVAVEELQRHAKVADVEAVIPVERKIEVPDGFFKSRTPKGQRPEAVVTDSARKGGMNAWLALDIEQKRTRAAGGVHRHKADASEEDALAEARRTYLRFEADSNELAVSLYDQITLTHSVEVRARAFAGMGCAHAQRCLLFGEPLERAQPQALSAAKAALWADPKLADAHLAMALALETSGTPTALAEAKTELEAGLASQPNDAWCAAVLGRVLQRLSEVDAAIAATAKALELDANLVFALETAARISLARGKTEDGLAMLRRAADAVPTYANAKMMLAAVLKRLGKASEAQTLREAAIGLATKDCHRQLLERIFETQA